MRPAIIWERVAWIREAAVGMGRVQHVKGGRSTRFVITCGTWGRKESKLTWKLALMLLIQMPLSPTSPPPSFQNTDRDYKGRFILSTRQTNTPQKGGWKEKQLAPESTAQFRNAKLRATRNPNVLPRRSCDLYWNSFLITYKEIVSVS